VKCHIWNIGSYGAETWTLQKVDHKYLETLEMWDSQWMEKMLEQSSEKWDSITKSEGEKEYPT
jgi:hypothetical protein